MLSLKDLYDKDQTRTARLRGREIVLKELSAAQSETLRLAYPRPRAPLGQDPNRAASQAHLLLPNENDPAHQEAISAWLGKVMPVELAIAMDFHTEDGMGGVELATEGKAEALAQWGDKATRELKRAFSERELAGLVKELSAIGESAEGNSSVPSAPGPSGTSPGSPGSPNATS